MSRKFKYFKRGDAELVVCTPRGYMPFEIETIYHCYDSVETFVDYLESVDAEGFEVDNTIHPDELTKFDGE